MSITVLHGRTTNLDTLRFLEISVKEGNERQSIVDLMIKGTIKLKVKESLLLKAKASLATSALAGAEVPIASLLAGGEE